MPTLPAPVSPKSPAMAAVLDTNIVLDWLVFRDSSCQLLEAAVRSGRLRWCATAAMRQELEHVLTRECLPSFGGDTAALWTTWTALVHPLPAAPASALRCSDPDDQKFVDLALQLGHSVLLSRDRAVLALARRARLQRVEILTAQAWSQRQASFSD